VFLENVNLNKFFLIIILLIYPSIYADDLIVADEFKAGEVISADTFNQIFDTIEKINRTIKDEDLIGTWNCSSINTGSDSADSSGWTKKGFTYFLESQLNFTPSGQVDGTKYIEVPSIDSPYNFATSSPNPFSRAGSNTSASGTYILYKGMIVMSPVENSYLNQVWSFPIDFVSNDRFILRQGSNNNLISNIVVCDSANPIPATPSNPVATISNGTINLTWTDNSVDEDGFRIYRKKDNDDNYLLLDTVTIDSYTDTSALDGETYNYYVTSFNENGESLKSKIIVMVQDASPPEILEVEPASGSPRTRRDDLNDFQAITISFSEPSTFYSPDRTNFWPVTLYVNEVEISPEDAWIPQALAKGIFHDSFLFGLLYNGTGNYKIIVQKDGILDQNGNFMAEDFVINYTVTEN
jgi:hypothetical protein